MLKAFRKEWDTVRQTQILGQFSWKEYLFTLALFGALTVIPVLMFGGGAVMVETLEYYLPWFILYWGALSLGFCLLTAWQKYRAFDKPMRTLGEAARKVAEGDFTVYIKPLHPPKEQNYVDLMFDDFNKMTEELGSLDMMKKDFIANVSHEFKTPLAVIQNYAQELKDPDLDEATRQEYVDTIIAASSNLSALIGNILRLNKIENQTLALNRTHFDLCRQLCDCAIGFENRWEEKDIDFGVEVEDSLAFYGDAELLALVWNNLLSNAIKFTPQGGTVTLWEVSDAESVTVQVIDSGCGMDEQTKKHIFDKFYQGDTSHSKEGNGLGLALVKRVTELAGGTVTVESEPGKGSTFTVRLPKQKAE